jgi:hypothetical protein
MLVSVAALSGCPGNIVGPGATTTNQAIEEVQKAIDALNANSAAWQQELNNLLNAGNADVKSLINNDVTNLLQRTIATGGAEFRCDTDFVGVRVKEGLEAVLAKLTGRTAPPPSPAVCQVSPTSLDMAARPNTLQWFGYNFDSPGVHVALKYAGGEIAIDNALTRPTHYLLTLDTSASTSAPLCNKQNRQIILRSGTADISTVSVAKLQCPGAPPPPPALPTTNLVDVNDGAGPNVGGNSEDHNKGGPCTTGYHREQCLVTKLSGSGHCEMTGWVTNDPHHCECTVHFGASSFNSVQCRITITETGDPQPQPPPPPCPCW